MTKVKVPHVSNKIWVVDYSDKPDRPFKYYPIMKTYFYLPDILHFWFVENIIQYKLVTIKDNWYIIFDKVEDAVLFKLTWGG